MNINIKKRIPWYKNDILHHIIDMPWNQYKVFLSCRERFERNEVDGVFEEYSITGQKLISEPDDELYVIGKTSDIGNRYYKKTSPLVFFTQDWCFTYSGSIYKLISRIEI